MMADTYKRVADFTRRRLGKKRARRKLPPTPTRVENVGEDDLSKLYIVV